MSAFYNEKDPFAAAWLRELIKAGEIAPGVVDDRDVRDIRPDELVGFTQCHFFAGIGGWPYALRFAGWPDDRPVWTASLPCQPHSAAGRGKGFADERHLWPHFFHLVEQCRPVTVFGEQVASPLGLAWLDLVSADMEGAGYAFWPVDLCAAGVGAPNLRQRLWFVADTEGIGGGAGLRDRESTELWGQEFTDGGGDVELADANGERCGSGGQDTRPETGTGAGADRGGSADTMADADRAGQQPSVRGRRCGEPSAAVHDVGGSSAAGELGHPIGAGLERHPRHVHGAPGRTEQSGPVAEAGPVNGFWRDADWLPCRDGKARPVEPGTFPLAHGIPGRVGLLRGYGNAINPEAGAEVILAFMDMQVAA